MSFFSQCGYLFIDTSFFLTCKQKKTLSEKAGRKLKQTKREKQRDFFPSRYIDSFFFSSSLVSPQLSSAVDRLDPLAVDEAPVSNLRGGEKGRKKEKMKEKGEGRKE